MKLLIFVSALVIGANAAGNLIEELQRLNATLALELIKAAGLETNFTTGGPYTVLAPSDAALRKLPEGVLTELKSDKDNLANIIKYHMIQGDVFSWDLTNGDRFTTLNGRRLKVTTSHAGTMFNGAKVILHDNQASNGVIYLIDTVLKIPEPTILAALQSRPELSTFLAAIQGAHLDKVLNRTTSTAYTVFAVTNSSFAKLPVDKWDDIQDNRYQLLELMDYHIHVGQLHKGSFNHDGRLATRYPGHYITIHIDTDKEPVLNHIARFSEPDIETENGIVHVIDHLLIPSTLATVIG